MSIRLKSSLVLCALAAAWLLVPAIVSAQSAVALQICSKRAGKAFKRYVGDAAEVMSDCQVDSLKDDERMDCATDEDVLDDLDKAADKLRREVKKCNDAALRAICPHGQREDTTLKEFVLNDALGTTARMRALDANLYSTSYAGCPRPLGAISGKAEDCAAKLARLVEDGADDLSKCVVKCELNAQRKSGEEPCIDEITGLPNDPKVIDCLALVLDDLNDGLLAKCNDEEDDDDPTLHSDLLTEIGCPAGRNTVGGLAGDLTDRLYEESVNVTNGIFFSECSESAGGGSVGGPTEPAAATLYPSLTATTVDCGQTLDAAFFGSDDEVRLDAKLDCSPAGLGSIGLIVSASDVTIDARGDYDLTGPSRSSNRTGTGILLAHGATNVTITRFRAIQRYAVGIGDSGSNDGLRVEDLTIRRNREAGVRTTSANVVVANVKADRNAIGFEMSGDDSTLNDCRALRSEPFPSIGIHILGSDGDGDGQIVRVNRCEVEGNLVGILAEGGPHLIEDSDVRFNSGDGMQIASAGSKVESNSVKLNDGNGIVVSGDGNNITTNRSDENAGHGYVISGIGNDINNNGAGSLTDQGNLGHGFLFMGFDSNVESNDAEANLMDGFQVDEDTFDFKSNTSNDNFGMGFDITVGGNNFDTNVAADNVDHEFSIAAGNVDDQGNRSDGATFSFGAGGGNF
ncbi:MAG: right-handed parallel beta-helix repeat-containing protein [Candidatus Binatia bacterium]|nr:right-handed parallel beta-helix repeat-containing protein [Candidatus Binatia bacterium]